MCVNYTPTRNEAWLREHFDVTLPSVLAGVDEVFPGGLTPLIRRSAAGALECVSARFGLIPAWAKDRRIARHTCNARSETAATKPSFRNAWRRGQIGVVAMDAFFEPNWESGQAVRWRVARADAQAFAVPCLWEHWRDPASGVEEMSCSLLTVDAGRHALLRRFHRPGEEKRSVVPLAAERLDAWWSSTADTRQACLALPDAPLLLATPAPRARSARSTVARPAPAPAVRPEDPQGSLF